MQVNSSVTSEHDAFFVSEKYYIQIYFCVAPKIIVYFQFYVTKSSKGLFEEENS